MFNPTPSHALIAPPVWRRQVAAGILAQGSEKIVSIALAVGYESEAAFSRAFKRLVGRSPAAWRRDGGTCGGGMKIREHAMLDELEKRFVAYARIDTQSDAASQTSPSTRKQFDLLNKLTEELRAIGAQDVTLTAYGAVLATIPATVAHAVPTVAWLAHVDTAPQFTGTNVKPLVHRDYQGQDIVLPDDSTQVLSPKLFPYLGKKLGETIITTGGATLLGADDKAGITIIMAAANHLLRNPQLPHGKIRVCFTPDEEIGRGVHSDLPKDLAADVAYTLDGAQLGEIVYETFSADQAKITIEGVSVHPGWAKDKLVNATHLMARVIAALPNVTLTPETTEGRQGFLHIVAAGGSAARCEITIILRDFETPERARQAALLEKVCAASYARLPPAMTSG